MAYAGRSHRNRQMKAPEGVLAAKFQQEGQGISGYTLAFMFIAIGFFLAEYIARRNAPDPADVQFGNSNLYYLSIAGFGSLLALTTQALKITPRFVLVSGKNSTFFNSTQILKQFVLALGLTLAVQITFGLILRPIFGTISPIEKVIYYFNGAVAEELWYRFFVQSAGTGILMKLPINGLKDNYFLAGFISLVPSSLYFMSQHATAYASNPLSFIGTFFLGIAFGISYIISNNIFIPIIIHGINNLFVAIWIYPVFGLTEASWINVFAGIILATVFIIIYVFKRRVPIKEEIKPALDECNRIPGPGTIQIVPIIKKNRPWIQRHAWVIIGAIVITALIVSFIFGSLVWTWYIPTAGSIP